MFPGDRVSVGDGDNVLDLDGGDDGTQCPWTVSLKRVKMANFMFVCFSTIFKKDYTLKYCICKNTILPI